MAYKNSIYAKRVNHSLNDVTFLTHKVWVIDFRIEQPEVLLNYIWYQYININYI